MRGRLLVEGDNDLHAIYHLMRRHTDWPQKKSDWPVKIEPLGNVETLLDPDELATQLKASDWDTIGVIADADDEPTAHWEKFRHSCIDVFPAIPETLPTDGLAIGNNNAQQLGFWLMPDCQSVGCLKPFSAILCPNSRRVVASRRGFPRRRPRPGRILQGPAS